MANVTTTIRAQPLRASNGMLAEENQRLLAMRDDLEKDIARMTATTTMDGDSLVRELARVVANEEAALAAKKAALARAEQALGTSQREEAERRQREDEAARAALEARLSGAADAYYLAIDQAEQHLALFVDRVNAAIAAHAEMRRAASVLARGVKVPLTLSAVDAIHRLGGRIGSMLRKVKLPDRGSTPAIGELRLPEEISPVRVPQPGEVPVVLSWSQKEQAVLGAAVAQLLERGGR